MKSCQYEVVVFTNRLCAHPSFYKAPIKEHDVQCFTTNKKQDNPKPKGLKSSSTNFFKDLTTKSSDFLIKFLK